MREKVYVVSYYVYLNSQIEIEIDSVYRKLEDAKTRLEELYKDLREKFRICYKGDEVLINVERDEDGTRVKDTDITFKAFSLEICINGRYVFDEVLKRVIPKTGD